MVLCCTYKLWFFRIFHRSLCSVIETILNATKDWPYYMLHIEFQCLCTYQTLVAFYSSNVPIYLLTELLTNVVNLFNIILVSLMPWLRHFHCLREVKKPSWKELLNYRYSFGLSLVFCQTIVVVLVLPFFDTSYCRLKMMLWAKNFRGNLKMQVKCSTFPHSFKKPICLWAGPSSYYLLKVPLLLVLLLDTFVFEIFFLSTELLIFKFIKRAMEDKWNNILRM